MGRKLPLPPPLRRKSLEAEEERSDNQTYLLKSRYPAFQVFHHAPIVGSRQVEISVRELYPLQQDIQEFRDIISADIEKNPE